MAIPILPDSSYGMTTRPCIIERKKTLSSCSAFFVAIWTHTAASKLPYTFAPSMAATSVTSNSMGASLA